MFAHKLCYGLTGGWWGGERCSRPGRLVFRISGSIMGSISKGGQLPMSKTREWLQGSLPMIHEQLGRHHIQHKKAKIWLYRAKNVILTSAMFCSRSHTAGGWGASRRVVWVACVESLDEVKQKRNSKYIRYPGVATVNPPNRGFESWKTQH